MKQAFEKVAQTYETVKKTVKEKWENFKNKFEGTKSEASQEIMKAESPDDLIASGKKLQEKGESLKSEKENIKQEESSEDMKHENINTDHEKASDMNNNKAEEAEKEKQQAIENTKKEAEDAQKAKELLETIKSGSLEKSQENTKKEDEELLEIIKSSGLESSQNEGKGINKYLGDSLKEIFHRWHSPEIDGKERARIKPEWEAISKKVISRLNTASDFKKYDFYQIGEDHDSYYKKWNALSAQEVKSATTGEEIREAMQHIRPDADGFRASSKIVDIAHDKYEKLTGERYPEQAITYL